MSINTARASFQQGFAKIVAQQLPAAAVTGGVSATKLTHVSHRSPTRLLPLTSSSVASAGAALVAISNYGGGMVQGDVSHVDVTVEANARLGVTAQGANRIYKSQTTPTSTHNSEHDTTLTSSNETKTKVNDKRSYSNSNSNSNKINSTSHTQLDCTIKSNAVLVVAPDPNVLFANSRYSQRQTISLEDETSSYIGVDWFAAGRVSNGECWQFHQFQSTTELRRGGKLLMRDSVRLDPLLHNFWGARTTALCNVLLAGPQSRAVLNNLEAWSSQLASRITSVRNLNETRVCPLTSLGGSGSSVYCGVTKIQEDVHVARIAASTNEDIYRILHDAMGPLAETFGLPFYKDRISSQVTLSSPTPRATKIKKSTLVQGEHKQPAVALSSIVDPSPCFLSDKTLWSAFMLVDAGLPTGSFAHSSGLEVAQQFGLLPDEAAVEAFVLAATQSGMQLAAPFVCAAHDAVQKETANIGAMDGSVISACYHELEEQCHALLVSNGPACQASMDQGHGLLRVALAWSKEDRPEMHAVLQRISSTQESQLQSQDRHHHVAPVFGMIAGLLRVESAHDACRMLQYSMARDVLSAAVRLNLVGPLANLKLLQRAQSAVSLPATLPTLDEASTSAPLLDVLHPHHDMLAVRLFRT